MTVPVYSQHGIPVLRIMESAAKWTRDQLVRWQPGAYQTSHLEGGHFESVYGVKWAPGQVDMDEPGDQATYSTSCLVRQPDGTTRTYKISIRVCGAPGEGEQ